MKIKVKVAVLYKNGIPIDHEVLSDEGVYDHIDLFDQEFFGEESIIFSGEIQHIHPREKKDWRGEYKLEIVEKEIELENL